MSQPLRPLDQLEHVIAQRAANPSEQSYTSRLLAGGSSAIGVKIVEEAAELVEAASEPDDDDRVHFIHEAADLLYHFLVMLRFRDVDFSDVETELARRFGVSGFEEKAGRQGDA